MSKIISVGTSTGKCEIKQKDVKEFVRQIFSGCNLNLDTMMHVFDNSGIETRHFSVPIEWFGKEHSFSERNELFIQNAIAMSREAINSALEKRNIGTEKLNHIYFITTTGLSTPSIDAILLNKLKFNNHIKRTPVWGLGCAAGAAGLSRAFEYTKAFPGSVALVVSIELCSLTFQKDDLSKSNLVATSLFSDGAAAVVVAGKESVYYNNPGIEILDSLSTTYIDSLDVMGWEIVDKGFKVLFSKDIPAIVENLVKPNIIELLSNNGLSIPEIKYYITHPGGMKVLLAYGKSLGISDDYFFLSREVLKDNGNMSSPTVLFVLKKFLDKMEYLPGERGIISSLGPGFSSELLLFSTA